MVRERLRGMVTAIPNIELVGEEDNEVDAMRGICARNPDLVILDLNLAMGSGSSNGGKSGSRYGMDVLRQIRQRSIHPLVIVLTNYFNPPYQKRCMELGADYFMDKSCELEMLGELLAKLAADPQPRMCA